MEISRLATGKFQCSEIVDILVVEIVIDAFPQLIIEFGRHDVTHTFSNIIVG